MWLEFGTKKPQDGISRVLMTEHRDEVTNIALEVLVERG